MSAEPDVGAQPSADADRRRRQARTLVVRLGALRGARAFWPLAAGAIAFAAATGALAWATHGGNPTLKLELAFTENACCSMQVWVNGTAADDITVLPIQWGRLATYSVPLYTAHVERLRMPIGEVPGSSVTVRRIWVTKGSRTIDRIEPAELRGVTTYDATSTAVRGGIRFTADGRHPFLDASVSLETGRSGLRGLLARVVGQPLRWLVALLLLGTLATLPLALARRRQSLLLLSVGLTLFAVYHGPRLAWQFPFRDDVSGAVGYSSYGGAWKIRERLVLNLSALAALAIPAVVLGIAHLRRRRAGDRSALVAEPAAQPSSLRGLPAWAAATLVAAPTVLVALAAMPNLRATIGAGRTVEYVPSWDSNNLIFWHYLVQKTDLMPMKDFFWPYGWQWFFNAAVPWGQVMSYVGYLSLWAYLALGTYLALARFFSGGALVRRFALVTAFWLSVALAGHVPFPTRYVAPLAVVLLFASLDARDGLRSWKRLLFCVALLELVLFEVAQAGYALVPIGFLLALELATQVRRTRPELLRRLGIGALTVAGPLAAAAVLLALTGELGATIDYYRQLGALTGAFSWPSSIDTWASRPADLAGFLFWAVPITLALGTFGLLARRDRLRLAHGVVVALGLLGLMLMQKQVMRPPVEAQLWLPVVFGLVFWAAVETSLDSVRRWSSLAAVAGTMAALLLVSDGYRKGWDDVTSGPERLGESIGALAHQRDEFAADARAQFAPARFVKFGQHRPVVRELQRDEAVRAGGPVWILGDETPITMMLGRAWPYYFNDFYDTSALAFQKKVIRRLERTPPARVVWNFAPESMIFDSVPHVVRVPLLFEWAVSHLAPKTRVGQFEILRPLRANEDVDLAWWRRRIGRSVHLGHVPELAGAGGRACSAGSDCGTFVVVDFPKGAPRPAQVTVPVTVDGLAFEVTFGTSSATRYVVPLDRVWFWAAMPDAERSVGRTDAEGGRVVVVRRQRDADVLY